ncbi:MBL fold metallo-hydrolase [Pseudomonas mandelii]|uniref:MBL fold metallo-hydrolase n=1 Tax=Pseudomonas mandelii TaxID=75612 RepID=UPI001C8399A9|nr:MBL fold metallo-hydrolase [Pseudomonas mandelii]QZA96052.1 MBL fold metallo-hydrolase [Pseudomonas mandelii]
MDQLIALPVFGDAFLLRRAGRVILVDGGMSSARLIRELGEYGIIHLDIVVCTHADYDHAGGLVDLLDSSKIKVKEFWLPGAWTETLPDLLAKPAEVVDGLIQELDDMGEADRSSADLGGFERRVHAHVSRERKHYRQRESSDDRASNSEFFELPGNEKWLERCVAEQPLHKNDQSLAFQAFQGGRNQIRIREAKGMISRPVATLWFDLINTAQRIRRIACQALDHGVPVRWFDYGEFERAKQASGGDAEILIPLNAVELSEPPKALIGMSYFLRLTPVNEECLVFLSPGHREGKGGEMGASILFTGDSPLGDGPQYQYSWLKWPEGISRKVIATAPHHGSESNYPAYDHLFNKVEVMHWIRSGGTTKHPGETYRSLNPFTRTCTYCPHASKPRRAVEILIEHPQFQRRSHWPDVHISGHNCTC